MTDAATHTLDDLVAATGFSKRQIRFYITKRLVPGAEGRGPNAAYGDETLWRLRRIAELKQERIAPTGRALTLDEIRHALDTRPGLEPEGAEASPVIMFRTAPPACERRPSWGLGCLTDSVFDGANEREGGDDDHALTHLLDQLHALLTGLASDSRPTATAAGGRTWSRLDSPDLEIHVRQPDTPADRARLDRMARQLGRMLDREE